MNAITGAIIVQSADQLEQQLDALAESRSINEFALAHFARAQGVDLLRRFPLFPVEITADPFGGLLVTCYSILHGSAYFSILCRGKAHVHCTLRGHTDTDDCTFRTTLDGLDTFRTVLCTSKEK